MEIKKNRTGQMKKQSKAPFFHFFQLAIFPSRSHQFSAAAPSHSWKVYIMVIFCPDKIKSRTASAQRLTARACLTSYSRRKKFLNSTRRLQSQDLKFHQATDLYLSYLGRRDEIFQTVNSLAQMLGMVFQTETCRVQYWNTSQQENFVRRRQNQNLVDLAVWS